MASLQNRFSLGIVHFGSHLVFDAGLGIRDVILITGTNKSFNEMELYETK